MYGFGEQRADVAHPLARKHELAAGHHLRVQVPHAIAQSPRSATAGSRGKHASASSRPPCGQYAAAADIAALVPKSSPRHVLTLAQRFRDLGCAPRIRAQQLGDRDIRCPEIQPQRPERLELVRVALRLGGFGADASLTGPA